MFSLSPPNQSSIDVPSSELKLKKPYEHSAPSLMQFSRHCFIARASVLAALFGFWTPARAGDSVATSIQVFQNTIRPIFSNYCFRCHSTEKKKGDMDLERFSSLSEALRHPKVWQAVAEQLANNEM